MSRQDGPTLKWIMSSMLELLIIYFMDSTTDSLLLICIWKSSTLNNSRITVTRNFYPKYWRRLIPLTKLTCLSTILCKISTQGRDSVKWRKIIMQNKCIENVVIARSLRAVFRPCLKGVKCIVQNLITSLPTRWREYLKDLVLYVTLVNNSAVYWRSYKVCFGPCWNTLCQVSYKAITKNSYKKFLLLMYLKTCLATL